MGTHYRYRSFFWPALLILVGVFALLVNSGLVPAERLDRVFDLWPLILIVIGLELVVRRAVQGQAAELAAALIVMIAIVGAAAYVALGPAIPTGTQTLNTSDKVGSLNHAAVTVDVGAANVTMRAGTSNDDLFRAHIEYSGPKPDVSLDQSSGELHIDQSNASGFFFQTHRFVLDLQMNPSVTWKIAVNSGASNDTFKLTGVHVASIELNTGASHEDITLGSPSVILHRPSGVAASASVSGGAVNLSFDGRQAHAIGSLAAQTGDYNGATDRYQIRVDGGASNVTVDTSAPSS
jgi:uncharacterized membrane protein YhaH (DUF805 family)